MSSSDTSSPSLRIEPAEVTATITDGQLVTQPYSAILTDADGTEHDVTGQTIFALSRPELGQWYRTLGAMRLELGGAAVGPGVVTASLDGMTAEAPLTVYSHATIYDGVSSDVASIFTSATGDYSCAPQLTYPNVGSVLPKNLDGLDVTYRDDRDDLFAVSLQTQYATVDLYTASLAPSLSARAWATLASTDERVSLSVAGLASADPRVACTTRDARLMHTDRALTGAAYFWSDEGGIWRHDVASTGAAEQVVLPAYVGIPALSTGSPQPMTINGCAGCAVSADGSRLALRLADGQGAIADFAADRMMMPLAWQSATFTPTADKLVVENQGELALIDLEGRTLGALPTTQGQSAMDPQLSPDGSRLVNVETTGLGPDRESSLVVRSYASDGDRIGDAQTLIAPVLGVAIYSPAWSPDGQWLAFTRATGFGSTPTAAIWVMKADGSQPAIQLTPEGPDVATAAQWVPGQHAVDGDSFFYLAFDAVRGDLPRQIWMMPFFPSSGLGRPAFRAPFQSASTSNHVAPWALAVVR